MRKFLLSLCFLVWIGILPVSAQIIQPISQNWTLSPDNLPITLPTTVQEALFGEMTEHYPHKLYDFGGEKAVKWVEAKKWTFKTTFSPTPALLNSDQITLRFPQLDTYAEIFLNGKLLGSASNYFRVWEFEVKEWIKTGDNELEIRFASSVKEGVKARRKTGYELPAGNDAGEQKIAPFVRKPQFHFGWDWGPRIVTTGIRAVPELVGWDFVKLENAQFHLLKANTESAYYEVNCQIQAFPSNSLAKWSVRRLDLGGTLFEEDLALESGAQLISGRMTIPKPRFWWPRGYGEQYLYPIEIRIEAGSTIISDTFQVGVRTVELIREADAIGESFYFKINGMPVFMKGANYIPPSHLVSGSHFSAKKQVLDQALAANMNMIRVWGGGEYETDSFYDYCDQKGLLVWQDLMFACSMYPGDDAFLKNAEEEIRQQVARIQHHPCLALWCGNNEMEVAFSNWGWQSQYHWSDEIATKIWNDYQSVFDTLVPAVLAEFDRKTPWLPSSPSSNWGKLENFDRGNMHYWGVWHGTDSLPSFREYIPRFMNEYGFQSWPLIEDLVPYIPEQLPTFESESILSRQKSYKGNAPILKEMIPLYGEPTDFNSFTYLSQFLQAEAMKIAIEAHRIHRDRCMGTLFWQLNDCWVGPSWSVIDGNGRLKPAYYSVQKAYAPLSVMIWPTKDSLSIYLVSDELQDRMGVLTVQVKRVQQQNSTIPPHLLPSWHFNVGSVHQESHKIFQKSLAQLLTDFDPAEVCLEVIFQSEGEDEPIRQIHYFVPPKSLKTNKNAHLTLQHQGNKIIISTDDLVRNVWLRSSNPDAIFSQNNLDVFPGAEITVTIEGNPGEISWTSLENCLIK